MGAAFAISALLVLYWTQEEYDLLKETDEIGRECDLLRKDFELNKDKLLEREKYLRRKWGFFRRAKYALNQWAAVMMGISLAFAGVKPLLIVISVGSYILITLFAPRFIFKLLNKQPS